MRPRYFVFTLLFSLLPLAGLFAHGAYHDVLDALTSEIDRNPQDAALFFRRAALHLSHEEWTSALIDLERVDRLKPEQIPTDGLRGEALNQGRQWQAALTVLNAHLEIVPGDVDALFQRGRARLNLGDLDAAEDYRASLSTASAAPAPERVIEAADAIQRRDGTQGAVAFIGEVIAGHPACMEPSILERAVALALECGQHDVALTHIEVLQRLAPRPEPCMARRAEVLAQAGRPAESTAAWAALRERLMALPNLERGAPAMRRLLTTAERHLGIASVAPVIAPPAPAPVSSTHIISTPNTPHPSS